MPRWRICDDDFYWFISFTDRGFDEITGKYVFEEINLWPCRQCGAMVMGVMRNQHKKFHKLYPMEAEKL